MYRKLELNSTKNSQYKYIDDLIMGEILGLIIIDKAFWFNPNINMNNSWITGPFCYNILDVYKFEKGFKVRGNVGLWKIPLKVLQKIYSEQIISDKINKWQKQFNNQLIIFNYIYIYVYI